tara:strand:+ start:297 stop:545 length:249 start_codon:yes stop_codon:yes gene_type:complete
VIQSAEASENGHSHHILVAPFSGYGERCIIFCDEDDYLTAGLLKRLSIAQRALALLGPYWKWHNEWRESSLSLCSNEALCSV